MAVKEESGAILTIDLDAIARNYRQLAARAGPAETTAVVKADAYGLGLDPVAPVLAAAGCKTFFVATLDEGMALRDLLPGADIHLLNGVAAGGEAVMKSARLVPVLNSAEDARRWCKFQAGHGGKLLADIHLDTGMSRLGMEAGELATLLDDAALRGSLEIDCVLSHLACADDPGSAMNGEQLAAFNRQRGTLKARRAGIAASSGIFLGAEFHLDLVRPGVALYGVNPTPTEPNPMAQVIRLQGKILQVRQVDTPRTVGYGATLSIVRPTRIATVAVGYADGYLRSAGNEAVAYVGDVAAPVLGRVSMDLTTLDITDAPLNMAQPGVLVDLIGPRNPVDDLAAAAGTIGYEILTRLGGRIEREYLAADGPTA